MSSLEQVNEFEQFTFKQWIALGTAIGGLNVCKGVMRGTMKVTVETIRRLTHPTPFTSTAAEINLAEFWQTRPGLWLSDDFKELILKPAKLGTVAVEETTRSYADLAGLANEAEIDAESPEGHIFENFEDFLAHLALQLKAQWGGVDGHLLNTEHKANLYRVRIGEEVLTVFARWSSGRGEWYVSADRPRASRWDAGCRAFFATAALASAPAL